MSDYGYPEQEHRETPHYSRAVLDQELRMYGDGKDFREGVVGIGSIYRTSRLMKYMQKAAILASVKVDTIFEKSPKGIPIDFSFLAGEMLGTHCTLYPLPVQHRQNLLAVDPLMGYMSGNKGFDPKNAVLGLALEGIKDFVTEGWQDALDGYDEPYQELLINAAIKMYMDKPNFRANEDSFLAGYIWSQDAIEDCWEKAYVDLSGGPV